MKRLACLLLVGGVLLALVLGACRRSKSPPIESDPLPTATFTPPETAVPQTPVSRPPSLLRSTPALARVEPTPQPLIAFPADRSAEDLPRYTLDIVLNYDDRQLQVTQDVFLGNSTSDIWDEVVFAVLPAHRPGLFALDQVQVTTSRHREMVGARLDGIMLHVPLPVPVAPGEPVEISLIYAVRVPPVDPNVWLPEGNLGAGDNVLQAGDWHPTLVPYRPGEGWLTWTYHPVGDPTVYPLATYDVQVFADPAIVIAAPGAVSGQAAVRHYTLPQARCFAFLASPDYRVFRDTVAGSLLTSYFLPGYEAAGQAALDVGARALTLYTELYGPYPAEGLVLAQNAYNGGMEYTGLVSLSSQAYEMYTENPRTMLVTLTAHEVAHQWWYGAVGNDQVHEPWLDEALAKYSELLYLQRYQPDLERWWWETHIYWYDPHGPVNRSIYDFPTTPVFIQQIYGQGARFLDDLRSTIGDAAFYEFLADYRRFGDGKLVTRGDFMAVLSLHTDRDLAPLLDRYFSAAP